jgi:DNA polymerase III subunit delta
MLEPFLKSLEGGSPQSIFLVTGDLVLAEPAGVRLASELATRVGGEVEVRRHPPSLRAVLDDLKTFSLFGGGKVILVVGSAVLANKADAAELIDEAEDALPVEPGGELPVRSRAGASRLLQALRLFELDPLAGDPAQRIAALPKWALEGGKKVKQRKPRGRPKAEVETLVQGLAALLEAARQAGLGGFAEGDLAELSDILARGLPPGHVLVLAERSVAAEHPLVRALSERKAVLSLGEVTGERGGGWGGLGPLVQELERQTGSGIEREALAELARRTLRQERDGGVEDESTARFAGEYRKLASLAGQGVRIDRRMVEQAVEDRGQEDVWQLLDAVGAGRSGEALTRLRRMFASAEDPLAARLSFFALLAGLARHIAAIRGLMPIVGVAPGESNAKRFETRSLTALTADLPGGVKSPLAGLHPFRVFKAYQAACRLPLEQAIRLPDRVLETEFQLKGGSDDPDAALANLVLALARPVG